MAQILKNCKKRAKIWKIWKKNRKKFENFFKKFWNFCKSENRKILKLVFGQKNCFLTLLRPKYIDLHSFFDPKMNILIFDLDRILIRNLQKNCGHFLWGLTPQKAHTENPKCPLQSLLLPRVLKSSMFWKS